MNILAIYVNWKMCLKYKLWIYCLLTKIVQIQLKWKRLAEVYEYCRDQGPSHQIILPKSVPVDSCSSDWLSPIITFPTPQPEKYQNWISANWRKKDFDKNHFDLKFWTTKIFRHFIQTKIFYFK